MDLGKKPLPSWEEVEENQAVLHLHLIRSGSEQRGGVCVCGGGRGATLTSLEIAL